jgi:hypothetical protein
MSKALFALSFAVAFAAAANSQALAQTAPPGLATQPKGAPIAALGGAGGSLARAWVSDQGVDTAGCGPIKTPCRTIQYAFDNVATPGGTIYVRDPSGYGARLSIGHSISIINDGSGAAIVGSASGDAVAIQAGPADTVILKGLSIHSAGVSSNGIHLISGGNLIVTNCTITGAKKDLDNLTGNGVLISPASGTTQFSFSDTLIANNDWAGFVTYPTGGVVRGDLTRVVVTKNGAGGVVSAASGGASSVAATQVTSSENGYWGFELDAGSMFITNSSAFFNYGGGADAFTYAGPISSFGNNAFSVAPTIGTLTSTPLK